MRTKHNKKPAGYWDNLQNCIDACKDAGTLRILHKKYRGAIDSIRKHGWKEICYSYLQKVREREYSIQQIKNKAKGYDSYKEFRERESGVYCAARKLGILDEITSHMSNRRKVKKYDYPVSLEIAKKEARKYDYRGDFQKKSNRIYNWARKRGILDSICSHMKRRGNKKLRCIYVAEFSNKHAYVGLTKDYESRMHDEVTNERETVYKYIKYSGLCPNYKMLHDYTDANKASELEGFYWKQYKDDGWIMLNIAKTGSLGGVGYSKKEVLHEAAKYQSLKDFRLAAPGYYQSGYRSDYWDEVRAICKPLNPGKMQESKIRYIISLFDRESDLRKYRHSVIDAARRLGIWDECTQYYKQKNTKQKKYKKIDNDELFKLAKLYHYRTDFQRGNPEAYSCAYRRGLLDEVCAHMTKKKQPSYKWTEKIVRTISKKYDILKDFRLKEPGAYEAARRLEIYEEITAHMKRSNSYKNTLQEAISIAKEHSSRNELFLQNRSVYNQIKSAMLLDKLLPKRKNFKLKKWTDQTRIEAASKCKTRGEYKRRFPQAHEITRKQNDWDFIAPHLKDGRFFWTEDVIAERCSHCHNMQELKEFDLACWKHVTKHTGKSKIARNYFIK